MLPSMIPYDRVRHVTAGSVVYPPGGTFGPRLQGDAQIVILHTGSMTVTIEGDTHVVKPGNAILLLPGRVEYFEFAKEQTTWHRWIAVHLGERPPDLKLSLDAFPFSIPITEELNRLTDLLLQLRINYAADSSVMLSAGHTALELFGTVPTTNRGLNVHPSVLEAKAWIHEHYAEEITLELLASHAGVSPEHLVRLFRASEETTPIRYLWYYRVLRAIELLQHSGLSVNEIAYRCGFKTSFHFARAIKKQSGFSASEIRKSAWET